MERPREAVARISSSRKGRVADEAHVSAEQLAPEEDAWIPLAHGNAGRAERAEAEAAQGTQAPNRSDPTQARSAVVTAWHSRVADGCGFDAEPSGRPQIWQSTPSSSPARFLASSEARSQESQPELHRRVREPACAENVTGWVQRQPAGRQCRCAQQIEASIARILPAPSPGAAGRVRHGSDCQARSSEAFLWRARRRAT